MSGPRLESPSTFRLVAASAAAVASLGVVGLGVQLGTHGLVGDGPGRNPGAASAAPAAAVVDARVIPVSDGSASLEQALQALAPSLGGAEFGSSFTGGAGGVGGTTAATPPSDPGAGGGGSAGPQVPPTTVPPTGPVTIPPPPAGAPAPTIPPALDPVLGPVLDALGGLTQGSSDPAQTPPDGASTAPADPNANGGTLQGLVDSLLGSH